MTKSRNIPIRFSNDLVAKMERAADQIGLGSASAFAKFATAALIRYFDNHPEEATGPDFARVAKELLKRQDLRTGDARLEANAENGNGKKRRSRKP